MRCTKLLAVTVAALLLVTVRAEAADPVAERLYADGRAAVQAKDWNRACALFQESQNREPAPGTLLSLGDCEEHRGKLVTARAQFQAAARLFDANDTRVAYAKQRASALEKRIARLRVRVEENAAVECDGALVDGASFGSPIDMDPGEHVFVVRAPGHAEMRSKVRLGEGESREIELTLGPALPPGAVAASGGTPARTVQAESARPAASAPPGRPAPGRPADRMPAYVALGVGAASVGVGVVTGLLALDAASTVTAVCPAGRCATQADVDAAGGAADRARTMALTSTLGLGVGIGAAAVGTYLLLRKPRPPAVAPAVGGGSVGLVLHGTF